MHKYIIITLIFIVSIGLTLTFYIKKSSGSNSVADVFRNLEKSGEYPHLDDSPDLRGKVTNNQKIRDDIYQWIKKKNLDEAKTKALEQMARTFQASLFINPEDKKSIREIDEDNTRSLKCLDQNFGDEGRKMMLELEKFTANTQERFLAYGRYNAALNGTTSTWPDGDTCEK
jgi:hypothetical protein